LPEPGDHDNEKRTPYTHPNGNSMSGFGINVTKLMESAGWPSKMTTREQASSHDSMMWVAGLIVVSDAEE
jgi:hypothetical protein